MTAGSDTGNGLRKLADRRPSLALSRATSARRVGSDSAAKVRSMRSDMRHL